MLTRSPARSQAPPPALERPARLPEGEIKAADTVRVRAIAVRSEPHVDVEEWEAAVAQMGAQGARVAPRRIRPGEELDTAVRYVRMVE